ncbi:VWA domain-containing protein [Rhodopseudomonas palustris]|nr:VWA domain-containing protein [Rhodopseudomonas palustris]
MASQGRIFVLSTVLIFGLTIGTERASAITPRLLECSSSELVKAGELLCEFDSSETTEIETVRQKAGDGRLLPTPAVKIGSNEMSPTAIALTLNSALEAPLFNRSKSALAALLENDSRHVERGLWTFATNVENIAPLGTAAPTLRAALDGLKNKGRTVELLRSLSEIRKQLAAAQPRRRLLVIATDGEFDDNAYQPSDIVASLRESNVRVVVLLPEASAERITRAQTLRRLADETDGLFLPVAAPATIQGAAKQINAFLNHSGSIIVTRQPQDSSLEIVLKNGTVLSQRVPAIEAKPEAPSKEAANTSAPDFDASDYVKKNPLQSTLLIVAALLVVGSAILWFVSAAQRRRQADKAEPKTVGDMRPILDGSSFSMARARASRSANQ